MVHHHDYGERGRASQPIIVPIPPRLPPPPLLPPLSLALALPPALTLTPLPCRRASDKDALMTLVLRTGVTDVARLVGFGGLGGDFFGGGCHCPGNDRAPGSQM